MRTRESLNAKIQWVKYTVRGFRNKENFKTAIYFHCTGLDLRLYPLKTRKSRKIELLSISPEKP